MLISLTLYLKACRFSLYSVFGVDESDSDEASNDSDTDSDLTEVCIFWMLLKPF